MDLVRSWAKARHNFVLITPELKHGVSGLALFKSILKSEEPNIKMNPLPNGKKLHRSEGLWMSILLFLFLLGCESQTSAVLTITGSEEYMSLISSLGNEFSGKSQQVSVIGNGMEKGFIALINGKSDIFYTHKYLDNIDRIEARARGINLIEIPVARDGNNLIVKANNIVERLSLEEIQYIFSGVYNNWNSFSTLNDPIRLFVNKNDSIRNEYFKKSFFNSIEWSSDICWVNTQESVIDSVKLYDNAIGLVCPSISASALNYIKLLSINTGDEVISPTQNHYPLGFFIYFYYAKDNLSTVNNFLQFCTSKEGQRIALQNCTYPIVWKH